MDVNFRKTATDTAYIVVGVGVLGFQQAQVKRRDAATRVNALRKDARSTVKTQADAITSKASGYAAGLSDMGSTVTGTVGSLGSTVSGTVGTTLSSTLDAVGSQVKAGAGAAKIADPRVWAEPVVGDIRVRIEPVVEQLRTISLPDISLPGAVSAIPSRSRRRSSSAGRRCRAGASPRARFRARSTATPEAARSGARCPPAAIPKRRSPLRRGPSREPVPVGPSAVRDRRSHRPCRSRLPRLGGCWWRWPVEWERLASCAGWCASCRPTAVTVVVNTADDEVFHGLYVCPDLDTVTYTLAGRRAPRAGLGSRRRDVRDDGRARPLRPGHLVPPGRPRPRHPHLPDRAPRRGRHDLRGRRRDRERAWGIVPRLLPMTDDRVATRVTVGRDDGADEVLAMQEWFVRERAEPPVVAVAFDGAATAQSRARRARRARSRRDDPGLPVEPVISIGPILAVPGIREVLARRRDRVVGVSPIIAGAPVKGPGGPADGSARHRGQLRRRRPRVRRLLRHARHRLRATGTAPREVEAAGVQAVVADTLMTDARVAAALARHTLDAVA